MLISKNWIVRLLQNAGNKDFNPTDEELEIELNWIDEHIGDHPYGVDIVIPNKYEGMDADMSAEDLTKMLQSMVPAETLDFGNAGTGSRLMMGVVGGQPVTATEAVSPRPGPPWPAGRPMTRRARSR